ncbi:hypothetical protein AQI88_13050 [Streptomyces cellostaticus]|uniref:Novel STAND NTPase 1 domain-containing protein n=1 Tax=Streptomyces cellostaticus TaxID=67285 RepID=A0A101NNE2_9ACTN|nr:WD40 repeat domain-containing protein [Streptomyces cellostaticus]KUM96209.1 hypothetical protein AQI88_13050 [Streptomyces cellostaticus]GHI09177.1 hypothetical protein Scel_74980 [Streptomyces cellostaticus]
MGPDEQTPPASDPPQPAGDGIHLQARATDHATILQAGRDQHVHYTDGAHEQRRIAPGAPVSGAECPYPGLAPFEQGQAQWFFGRDRLLADLMARLDQRLRTGRAQVVVAPSGAGKSSLLRAGLLAGLDQAALPGSDRWPKMLFTPTAEPLRALATQLATLTGTDPAALTATLTADPHQCVPLLRRALGHHHCGGGENPARVVLVVDQFEEIFTLCSDDRQRRTFVDLLSRTAGGRADDEAAAKPAGPHPVGLVVLGIRADFYASCVDFPQLRTALEDAPLVVGSMSDLELREAIRFPARNVGLDLEPGLVELLLRDLGSPTERAGGAKESPGAQTAQRAQRAQEESQEESQEAHDEAGYEAGRLPLLAHALRVSWQQRHGATLTVQGYQATGGIQRAIATTAEGVFARLDAEGQRITQSLFLRLVKVREGGEDTRRRLARAELAGVDTAVDAVVDEFTRARLLTRRRDTVEITHEALLHSWPRLREWIDADRAGRLTHQNLEETAAAWERDHRDTSLLYRGSRLEVAGTWAATAPPGTLSTLAQDFLAACSRARRRTTRIRRTVIAVLAALGLIASAAAAFAFQQRGEALDQRDLAVYNRLLAEADQLHDTDLSLSAQLNLVAYRMRPDDETYTRLITTADDPLSTPLSGHSDRVTSVAYSPDGRVLATGSYDKTVRLWNVSDPTRPRPLGAPLVGDAVANDVTFSPDGHTLVAAGADARLRLWNVSDPARPAPLGTPWKAHAAGVSQVAFSPDGRLLGTGGYDRTVRLWSMADPARPTLLGEPLTGPEGGVWSVAFSPDGRTLAMGSADNTIRLWNVSDPARPVPLGKPLKGHSGIVSSVAFSPDGHLLAATSQGDSSVRLWDVSDPAHPKSGGGPLRKDRNVMTRVAFSPDSRILAVGSGASVVRLWNVSNPASPKLIGRTLTGHTNLVAAVAFAPDGHTLATGSYDGSVRLWNIPATWLIGPANSVLSAAFSRHGHLLATGSYDRTARLWDVSDPARPQLLGKPLTGQAGPVSSVAFGPVGRTLATGSADATVWLWDVSDPARPVRLGASLTSHTGAVNSVAFGPDGRTLATGSADATVRLWDVSDPARPLRLGAPLTGHTGAVNSVAFSPDGRTLATGSADATVRLWDVSDPARPALRVRPLAPDSYGVSSVAFSPDGHTLATGSYGFTARLWNVSVPNRPTLRGKPLKGHTSAVWSVAFSPDGRTLATGSFDQSVRLWNVSDPDRPSPLGGQLIGHNGGVWSVAFSPDGRTLASGGGDFSVRLWGTHAAEAIDRICATTRNTLTAQQWRRYVGDALAYRPPCA